MRPLTFTSIPSRGNRHHFVTEDEVRVVLERLPTYLWERLATVHFNDRANGCRRLGYVTGGKDAISLCALPQRLSLTPFLRGRQTPTQFGALRGCQWPLLAVRRFMLYNVFLHELGHLQVVKEKAKSTRRKFAGENRAEQFADHWRRELWSRPFPHPDPVHNPPSPEELKALSDGWSNAHSDYKQGLFAEKAKRYEAAVLLYTRAVDRYSRHEMALERLGVLTYAGKGTTQSTSAAIEHLDAAIELDPTLLDANLFLGFALAREGRETEARRYLERAIRLDVYPPLAMAAYADVLADWGDFADAEALFQKAIKRDPGCVFAIRDYGRSLIRNHNPEADNNIERAIKLFERAVAVNPQDAESHYRLGDLLSCLDDKTERAIEHLKRSLKLNPEHAKAAEVLAELEEARGEVDRI